MIIGKDISQHFSTAAKGLGHAVLCAKEAVSDEWFVLLLPDMLIDAKVPCAAQMMAVWEKVQSGIIATAHAPKELISQYGIIATDRVFKGERLYKISGLVEKPKLEDAPGDLFIVGRYLLPPSIFKYLEKTKTGVGGEIQITDALAGLIRDEEMYAFEYEGVLHDTGDKLEYSEPLKRYMKELINK